LAEQAVAGLFASPLSEAGSEDEPPDGDAKPAEHIAALAAPRELDRLVDCVLNVRRNHVAKRIAPP
jgi:hypothetical protein